MGGTLSYIVTVAVTVIACVSAWKAIGWWERRSIKKSKAAVTPMVEANRDKSRELSQLAALVDYGHEALINESSKMAPARTARC